jgi:hypothetical protein
MDIKQQLRLNMDVLQQLRLALGRAKQSSEIFEINETIRLVRYDNDRLITLLLQEVFDAGSN